MMNKLKTIYTIVINAKFEDLSLAQLILITSLYSLYIFILYFFAYQAGTIQKLPHFVFILLIPLIVFFAYLAYKIWQQPEIGILVVTFFLPYERIGSLYHVLSVNVRLSQVFAVVTFIAFLYQYIITKKFNIKLKNDYSLVILIIFVLINIASLTNAVSKLRSTEILLFELFVFSVYILLSNLLQAKKILAQAVKVILSLGFVLGIYGLYQFAAGNTHLPLAAIGLRYGYSRAFFFNIPRIQGTALEPLYWGDFLLIPLAMSLSLFIANLFDSPKRHLKYIIFLVFTFAIILTNIILSFSRGALYASAVVIVVVVVMYLIRSSLLKKITLYKVAGFVSAFILVPLICFLLIEAFHAPVTLSTFKTRESQFQDQSGRAISASQSLQIFKQNSILGVGVGGFAPNTDTLQEENLTIQGVQHLLSLNNTHFSIVNNQYLEVLTETGIFGLIVFVAFFAYIIISSLRAFFVSKDPMVTTAIIAFLAALVGILVQYVSFSTLYIMHIWVLLALLGGTTYNVTHKIWKK